MEVTKLQAPFGVEDMEWRVQQAGSTQQGKLWAIVVPYITNRAIQQRLDDVCGIDGWKNEYTGTPNDKGTLCGISIKFEMPTGKANIDEKGKIQEITGYHWITKWDGAEDTGIEAVKGGLSSAMKRAAVQWGIGRYLYKLNSAIVTPQYDRPQSMDGWEMAKVKLDGRNERIFYKIPTLPQWATPKGA